MSGEVARRPAGGVSTSHPPEIPEWLVQAADWWIDPERRPYRTRLLGADRKVARQAAADLHACMQAKVNEKALAAWLGAVSDGVSNPPQREAFVGRVKSILIAAGGLPVAALDKVSLSEALRKFKFWPSAAELLEVLEARATRLRKLAEALEAIGSEQAELPNSGPTTRAPPGDDEKAVVRDLVRAFTNRDPPPQAAQGPPGAARAAAREKARHLSQEQLVAAYTALAGSPNELIAAGARMRLEKLREGVGGE